MAAMAIRAAIKPRSVARTCQLCAETYRLTKRNARRGCACCPANLSAVAESPAKFEARPLSSRGSLWVWTSTQPGVASRPSESISRLLGPALPPTCVIKPLSIGYYPRKPRHRATNGGLVHPASPARFPLVRMGWCGTTCNRLRCMTPSRNLTARAFRAAVPLVRIHLPPARSLRTITSEAAKPPLPFFQTSRPDLRGKRPV